jgi:outer membrane receptor for Fe3+-dicitrate
LRRTANLRFHSHQSALGNIESMDVVRSGGAVRYGPQNRERGDNNS